MSLLRTILALIRPAHLPVVWSGALAGWWLGGNLDTPVLPLLLGGVTALFIGGALLNDAFDAEHDQQQHPARAIPSGVVETRTVWRWGLFWLAVGALLLLWIRPLAGGLGLVLVVFVVVFNAVHRLTALSPVLPGVCRLLLYLLAAATATRGVTGWAIWCGLAAGIYVIGAGYLARAPRPARPLGYWPVVLIGTPILLAVVMNAGSYREAAWLISAVLALWTVHALRYTLWAPGLDFTRTGRELVAANVLVDWLAVAPVAPRELGYLFIAFFVGCLALQRVMPADSGAVVSR
jgi:4-hydroxybenzoate polyprenyltransferase